jgi:predicted hydrocarbon binding protein
MDATVVRGNYFAESGYLTGDLSKGAIRSRSGERALIVSGEFFAGLFAAIGEVNPSETSRIIHACGRDWGACLAERWSAEWEAFYGRPLAEFTMAQLEACLTSAFRQMGWGQAGFDFSRYAQGIVVVTMKNPFFDSQSVASDQPEESLLEGLLAGLFSHVAGVSLGCRQSSIGRVDAARFIVTAPERLAACGNLAGRGHDAWVEALMQTTAP